MIGSLTGKISAKSPTQVIIEVNGIGYLVHIPLFTYDALPAIGETVKLYTVMTVREDAITLYGFATEPEKQLFEVLIGINNIGPKSALGILSSLPVYDFCYAIVHEDLATLTDIQGVGPKTAQRLILELKEKIGTVLNKLQPPAETQKAGLSAIIEDAIEALIALGCKPAVAKNAIEKAYKIIGTTATVEALIKEGLKHRNG
ncbi:MAG: Holliday junction branch migration protein RuvA [bacterium]|nr:Holliday junction branch migration protein RuvA [bacterium]